MPFRFRLQTVLSLREILERHEESILQRIQADVAQVVHQVHAADEAITAACRNWQTLLRDSTAAVQLASLLEEERRLLSEREGLEKKLAQLTKDRDHQMRQYQQAHRDHEVLLSIKRERMVVYQQQQARAQQKLVDDIVMSRWPRD